MINIIFRAMIALAAAFMFSSAASAQIAKRTVKAGTTTGIGSLYVYGVPTCYPEPLAKVGRISAANGKVTIKKISVTASSGTCKGKRFKAIGVYYRPNPGFRGTDNVTVDYSFPSYDENPASRDAGVLRYRITVK